MNKNIFKTLSKKLNSPDKIQKFLKKFKYNKKDTLRSAHSCLISKEAHCMEAAVLAAAIMEQLGYPPLVLSFESIDDLDHVLFVFKRNNKWGSIGYSRDLGLYGRPPIFRSIRDLTWSYFEPYIDKTGLITAYQVANLNETGCDWRFSKKNIWKAERYLLNIKHIKLKSSKVRFKKIKNNYLKNGPIKPKSFWW